MALSLDRGTLEAALAGYQQQLNNIQEKMTDIRRKLGQAGGGSSSAKSSSPRKAAAPRKHRMSEEGRARIAAAQRARWAKQKKAQKSSGQGS